MQNANNSSFFFFFVTVNQITVIRSSNLSLDNGRAGKNIGLIAKYSIDTKYHKKTCHGILKQMIPSACTERCI